MHADKQDTARLALTGEGYIFVGGRYASIGGREVMRGQMYVRYFIPEKTSHPYPLIFIPGAGLTGTCFEGTPDGRCGWTTYFLQQGYAVYSVDQVERGRSAYSPGADGSLRIIDVLEVERDWTAPSRYNSYPQAHLHTQWPGTGMPGDPVFDQFYASIVPSVPDLAAGTSMRHAIGELLRLVGPAILVTHSQSGKYAWPITDDQPHLVAGNLVIEGAQNLVTMLRPGPPDWFGYGPVKAPWGITDLPITYSPEVSDPSELSFEQQEEPDGPGLIRCYVQAGRPRQLPRLKGIPVLDIVGQASFVTSREHSLPKYLAQAGVASKFIRLEEAGITGNGHLMMVEKNNLDIADFINSNISATIETESNWDRLHPTGLG